MMAVDEAQGEGPWGDGGAGAVLDRGSQWLRAWSQTYGFRTFYVVPSFTGRGSGPYYTSEYGCTCPAARRRGTGDCKHQRAVREYNALTQDGWGTKGWTLEDAQRLRDYLEGVAAQEREEDEPTGVLYAVPG